MHTNELLEKDLRKTIQIQANHYRKTREFYSRNRIYSISYDLLKFEIYLINDFE